MIRANMRNTSIPLLAPTRKISSNSVINNKKALLKPIPPKPNNSNEADTENQPISDFPTPPVPIVSFLHGQPGEMIPLPQISTAPHGEIPQLALQKLKQCCRSIDFSDKQTEAASKITKKATLNELIDCYNNPKMFSRLTRECHQQLIEMFAANVFRPQPNIPRAIIMSDDAVYVDTAWSHLNLVYILFLKFLDCNIDQRILQFKLDPKFISSLFSILDFPDERERIQAKTVIAKIHANVPPQRKILYQLTLNLLLSVPEGFEMNAASHLLDLFFTFTSSTPPPLPQSLLHAFEKVLLPLHLPERCQRYFNSLVRCIMMLVRKDIRLGNSLIHFLVEHWPLTLDHKSELFIEEISHLLDDSMPKCIDQNIEEVLRFICISAESSCTTLANKALKFMLNNRIQNLIVEKPEKLLQIIFPSLFRIARGHWQRNLQLSALNVMNALVELVPIHFAQAASKFKEDVLAEAHRKEDKKKLWESIAQIAIEKDHSIDAEAVNCEFTDFYGEGKELPQYLLQARLNYKRHNLKGRSGSVVDLTLPQSNSDNQDQNNYNDDNAPKLRLNNRIHKTSENNSERRNNLLKNPTKRRMIHQQRSTPLMIQSIEKSPISFPVEKNEEEGYPLVNSRSMPKLASINESASDSEVQNEKKENDQQNSSVLQDDNINDTNQKPNISQNEDDQQDSTKTNIPQNEDDQQDSTKTNISQNEDDQQDLIKTNISKNEEDQQDSIKTNISQNEEDQQDSTKANTDQITNQNLEPIKEQKEPPVITPNLYSNMNQSSYRNPNYSVNQNLNPNTNQSLNQKFNQISSFNQKHNFGMSGINQNLSPNPIGKTPFSNEFFPSSDLNKNPYQNFGNSLMNGNNSMGSSFNTNVSLFDDNEAIKEEDEDQYNSNQQQNNLLTIIEE